jgi:hypothetical protein
MRRSCIRPAAHLRAQNVPLPNHQIVFLLQAQPGLQCV